MITRVFIISIFSFFTHFLFSQESLPNKLDRIFTPSDTLNTKRIYATTAAGITTYSAFSIGFYHLWYKNYSLGDLHLYNDWNEWQNMDKAGHLCGAYIQGVAGYKLANWVGFNKSQSIWSGVVLGSLAQTTIEVMDGLSEKWGFSIGDIAFNTIGVSLFAIQQNYWDEQRITFKISNIPRKYSTEPIYPIHLDGPPSSLDRRASQLFGESYANRFFKDYNSQVIWASFNLASLFEITKPYPKWLNIAIGFSGNNMYGGYENKWKENGFQYHVADKRYAQIFIAPDIDFWRIRSNNAFINTILDILNGFHLPLPALEWNTKGEFHFHLLM